MRLANTNALRPALLALTKFEQEEHDRLRLALIAFQELWTCASVIDRVSAR